MGLRLSVPKLQLIAYDKLHVCYSQLTDRIIDALPKDPTGTLLDLYMCVLNGHLYCSTTISVMIRQTSTLFMQFEYCTACIVGVQLATQPGSSVDQAISVLTKVLSGGCTVEGCASKHFTGCTEVSGTQAAAGVEHGKIM